MRITTIGRALISVLSFSDRGLQFMITKGIGSFGLEGFPARKIMEDHQVNMEVVSITAKEAIESLSMNRIAKKTTGAS